MVEAFRTVECTPDPVAGLWTDWGPGGPQVFSGALEGVARVHASYATQPFTPALITHAYKLNPSMNSVNFTFMEIRQEKKLQIEQLAVK